MSWKPELDWTSLYPHIRTALLSIAFTLVAATLLRPRSDPAPATPAIPLPKSTMPAAEIGLPTQGPFPGNPYRQEYDFTSDWFTNNIPVWEKALAPYKGKPDLQYLEVGLYEGRSILWILDNVLTDPSCRATGLDLFSGALKDRYFKNLKRSGHADQVTTVIGFSQVELRRLPLDTFSIIYIDGSHWADDVLEDLVLSWRLLKEGGILILDDYLRNDGEQPVEWGVKPAVDVFHALYGRHFIVIHNRYQIMLKKQSPTKVRQAS